MPDYQITRISEQPPREWEAVYDVDETGVVTRRRNGKVVRQYQGKKDKAYLSVYLWLNGKRHTMKVHRLVAQKYIPNPENKPQVNHKDGDATNNHLSNLEWATAKENVNHAFDTGLVKWKRGMERHCLTCNAVIRPKPSVIKRGSGKFCSRACTETYASNNPNTGTYRFRRPEHWKAI